jgi:two-component system phosphate regulon sensor histidine kinase PhoR
MKSTRKIGLLLTLVFLLPALFFSVYEISSLDNDEKMIQEIYNKQLEAILFSVNQYSDDILGSWTSRIETNIEFPVTPDSIPKKVNDLLMFSASLQAIFISDSAQGSSSMSVFGKDEKFSAQARVVADSVLSMSRARIQQLLSYKRNGYQKVERVDVSMPGMSNLQCLVFILGNENQGYRVGGLFIDPELFIEEVVGPRLQTISRDQFVLFCFRQGVAEPIYSTSTETESPTAEALTKDFWLFPDYTLGIRSTGNTLQTLVRERTTVNLMLLVALDVILIIAVILVFRNLKREVDLAQNKSDFVSNVSHEIRTPLALISMFAETLELDRVPTEEKKREYYGIISKEAQRLSGIVNKILNFSQTEAKKKTLHIESLHLDTEINSILTTYDFHLRNKGFHYTFAGTESLWIMADREALTEMIINLIDNAMKYSEDKKQIEIATGREGQYGFVAVRDHGMGISAKDQKHIFDKFYRVSSGNLAKSRGTGLGLSLVKQLMEEQQGRITVNSEPGKGSRFTLFFLIERTQ